MQQYKSTEVSLVPLEGLKLEKRGSTLSFTGTVPYNFETGTHSVELELQVDRRRDLNFFEILGDGERLGYFIRNNKLVVTLDALHLPEELQVSYVGPELVSERQFVQPSRLGLPEETWFETEEGVNFRRILGVYSLKGSELNKALEIDLIPPEKGFMTVEVVKNSSKGTEVLYKGVPRRVSVPIEFSYKTLEYENFQLLIRWTNKVGGHLSEIVVTELVKENQEDFLVILPEVKVNPCYFSTKAMVTSETNSVQTVLTSSEKIKDLPCLIELNFAGAKPAQITWDNIRVGSTLVQGNILKTDKGAVILIPELVSNLAQKGDEVSMSLKYDFGNSVLKQRINITKLFI